MNRTLLVTALIAGAAFGTSFAASAQTNAATTTERDVKQEQRIENGLQNGTITTRENAALQRDEAHVDRLQAKDMKNGSLSPAEKAQLTAAQNKTSRDIATAKNNGVDGNPLSASSQRAQADTQRNINQQTRINAGVKDGSLTTMKRPGWSAASRMWMRAKRAPVPMATLAPASNGASRAPTTARARASIASATTRK